MGAHLTSSVSGSLVAKYEGWYIGSTLPGLTRNTPGLTTFKRYTYSFAPRGNQVFHHHVFPLRAGNGKPHRQRVAGLNRPIQWIELVADAVLLPNRTQFEILPRQREIERTHIREFLLVGIVLATQ